MKKLALLLAVLPLLAAGPSLGKTGDEVEAVKAMLRDFHAAGRAADGERVFSYLLPDAVLFGTDSNERWTVEAYRAFARPYMDQGVGWSGTPTEQNVFLSADGTVAWFDERVDKPGFQEVRVTGVLLKVDGAWKVAQFNFAFTLPNELAREVAAMVEELETKH